jgi:hypothetical protein
MQISTKYKGGFRNYSGRFRDNIPGDLFEEKTTRQLFYARRATVSLFSGMFITGGFSESGGVQGDPEGCSLVFF